MIWIRIVSKDGAPAASLGLGVPLAARFGDSVGDVGRGVGCTLVLPDPNREISRKQALVTWQGGRHFIRPIGTNVDIELNGRVLQAEVEAALEPGAEIRIGPYRLRVERALSDATVPAPPLRPAVEAPPIRPLDSPPRHPALAPRPQQPPPARPAAQQPPPVQPATPSRNAAQDPPAIPNTPNRPPKAGAFDELMKRPAAPPQPPSAPQHPPPVRPPPKAGAVEAAAAAPPKAEKVERAAATPTAAVEKTRADPARKPEPAASPAAPNQDFVGGVFAGLGVAEPPAGERSTDKGRLIGELLRESLAGTIELLAARQIAKKNLGANATMLQTRGNNPLKFSPNVDAALTHLLGPPMRGFIGPREAVHDALGDLRAHQVAMLAGMRAALEAVLERFDPVALEARLAPKGMVEQLMPVNRRARLWESFGEQYASILREVEDDWDALFGRAFLQAYERQLAELAKEEKDES